MNELILHTNESDREDRITKKSLKELKVIIYTNKVYLHFLWLNHKKFMVKHVLLEKLYVG